MEMSITDEAKPPDLTTPAQSYTATKEGTEDSGKGLLSTKHGKIADFKA